MRQNYRLIRVALSLVTMSLVAGCADWKALQAAAESTYIGKNIDALYDEYGVPIGIAPKSDGGYFVQFETYRSGFQCTADVTTNSSRKIVKIVTGGQNGCITPAWAH